MTPEEYKSIISAKRKGKAGGKPPTEVSPKPKLTKNAVRPAYWLEKHLQAYVVSELHRHGYVFAASMEGMYTHKGTARKSVGQGMTKGEPDLRVYLAGGRCVFIELKKQDGPVKPDQKARHELLRGLGFEVHVLRAPNGKELWDEVHAILCAPQ